MRHSLHSGFTILALLFCSIFVRVCSNAAARYPTETLTTQTQPYLELATQLNGLHHQKWVSESRISYEFSENDGSVYRCDEPVLVYVYASREMLQSNFGPVNLVDWRSEPAVATHLTSVGWTISASLFVRLIIPESTKWSDLHGEYRTAESKAGKSSVLTNEAGVQIQVPQRAAGMSLTIVPVGNSEMNCHRLEIVQLRAST